MLVQFSFSLYHENMGNKFSRVCRERTLHWSALSNLLNTRTAWKVSVFGFILVRIFLHSDWMRRDYLSVSISPYSNPMRENADQNNCKYEHFFRSVVQVSMKDGSNIFFALVFNISSHWSTACKHYHSWKTLKTLFLKTISVLSSWFLTYIEDSVSANVKSTLELMGTMISGLALTRKKKQRLFSLKWKTSLSSIEEKLLNNSTFSQESPVFYKKYILLRKGWKLFCTMFLLLSIFGLKACVFSGTANSFDLKFIALTEIANCSWKNKLYVLNKWDKRLT